MDEIVKQENIKHQCTAFLLAHRDLLLGGGSQGISSLLAVLFTRLLLKRSYRDEEQKYGRLKWQ